MSDSGDENYSFETAEPVKPRPRPAPLDGDATELALISAVMGDPDGAIWARSVTLPVEAFTSIEARIIWRAWQGGIPIDDLPALIKATKLPYRIIGELGGLDRMGTMASVHLAELRRRYKQRLAKALAKQIDGAQDIDIEAWQEKLDQIGHDGANCIHAAHPITNYAYPEAADANVLLGSEDYLTRGGGFFFVSHAGAGKSSWIMDATMSWALGRPWMGIRSNGKLKSLIIEAEDSERYLGKVQGSFAYMQKLKADDLETLGQNCIIARVRGISGQAFFAELRRLTLKHKPDLVVINPIYLYAEGDIARSEYAQPFLVGLDAVNKEEKWGYILIHHTGKPAQKDAKGGRAEIEDWESVYMGFGSSYLANWPRCSALLEPRPGEKGKYIIRLGKGGLNAGIAKEVPQGAGMRWEAVTRIGIKHSEQRMLVGAMEKPVIYWELDPTEYGQTEAKPADSTPKVAAKLPDFLEAFAVGLNNAKTISQTYQRAVQFGTISKVAFETLTKRAVEDGFVVRDMAKGIPHYYRRGPTA